MIAESVVEEIRRLLAEGHLSQRKIARRVGVSRGTVATIASGRRPDYEAMRRAAREAEDDIDGPLRRCLGCGGMVHVPCRLCRARQVAAERPRVPMPAWLRDLSEPLGIGLRGEHLARYEAIHAEKVRAASETATEEVAVAREGSGPVVHLRLDEPDWPGAFSVVDEESDPWAMELDEFSEAFDWENASDAGVEGLCGAASGEGTLVDGT